LPLEHSNRVLGTQYERHLLPRIFTEPPATAEPFRTRSFWRSDRARHGGTMTLRPVMLTVSSLGFAGSHDEIAVTSSLSSVGWSSLTGILVDGISAI
jgi:hypothetical protein